MRLRGLFRRRDRPPPLPRLTSDEGGAPASPPDIAGRIAFLKAHILLHSHVPKTGGSALSAGLSAIVGGVHAVDFRLKTKVRMSDISAEEMQMLYLLAGHFKFGVHTELPGGQNRIPLYIAAVRHPVERAVSSYRYFSSQPLADERAHVAGRDFEAAWEASMKAGGAQASNPQAAVLTSTKRGQPIDADFLRQQTDESYFLIIPQLEIPQAIRALRTAFGLPWTKVPRINVSTGFETQVTDRMRDRIIEANPVDMQLYDHITRDFDQRLQRACDYIARKCLVQLEDRSA